MLNRRTPKKRTVGSNPTLTARKYAPVVELVDTLVLEASARAWEFESPRGHQSMNPDHTLYIGDVDEQEVVEWLTRNLSPVVFTTRTDGDYYDMYHGDHDLWILHSQDVSDVSGQYDTITQICFAKKEDRLLFQLTFGGTC